MIGLKNDFSKESSPFLIVTFLSVEWNHPEIAIILCFWYSKINFQGGDSHFPKYSFDKIEAYPH